MQSLNRAITYEECCECVRYRVICETWNGVICREHNTIKKLKAYFPKAEFVKVPDEIDYEYAVDYEVFCNDKLICAIQIKPSSYFNGNAQYLVNARSANKRKNSLYTSEKQVPVFNVSSRTSGEVENADVLTGINKLIK